MVDRVALHACQAGMLFMSANRLPNTHDAVMAASYLSPPGTLYSDVDMKGSGHHGLIPVLRDLQGVNFISPAEQLLTDFWDPTVPMKRRAEIKIKFLEKLEEHFDSCVVSVCVCVRVRARAHVCVFIACSVVG